MARLRTISIEPERKTTVFGCEACEHRGTWQN